MSTIEITHNTAASRFETHVSGELCVAVYELQSGVMAMTHTVVPPAAGGRGVAAALVDAALNHARDQGYKVRPVCSYVVAYFQRHPELSSLLA